MSDRTQSLSVKEVAARLRVSERHITNLIARRMLPSLKLGRRRIIREDALRQYLERVESIPR